MGFERGKLTGLKRGESTLRLWLAFVLELYGDTVLE